MFGAGIYCGTYLVGTNFVYRLMFLLLCVPQLQDWQVRGYDGDKAVRIAEQGLFGIVLGVLWLNGNANGHSIFLLTSSYSTGSYFLYDRCADVELFTPLYEVAGLSALLVTLRA